MASLFATMTVVFEAVPAPSQARLDASLNDAPLDTEKLVSQQSTATQEKAKTVLYLAYGSNLCNETFRGVRGIRPLSQVNVMVPSLRLTFDLRCRAKVKIRRQLATIVS